MRGRPSRLSKEVWGALVASIRGGVYDWVAADVLRLAGAGGGGEEPFARLLKDVRRARAEARMGAEQKVLERDLATC